MLPEPLPEWPEEVVGVLFCGCCSLVAPELEPQAAAARPNAAASANGARRRTILRSTRGVRLVTRRRGDQMASADRVPCP